MNIHCTICSDLFTPAGEIFSTQCGHMFHFECLTTWMERSRSCPQCRERCTEKTIHKIYFNLANTDVTTEDVGTLQNKIGNMQFQMTLKERDIKKYTEEYKKVKKTNAGLKDHIKDLNHKAEMLDSHLAAVKSQMVYFKSKAKESDKLTEELVRLKNKIKDMENVHMAINGTREQVNDMLRNENNIESLALLAATLKKSLVDADRRKRDMEHNLNRAQNEATRYRRECNALENQNSDLKKELQHLKSEHDKEKQYLKNKISELNKRISAFGNLDITNTSIKRIETESPVNFQKKPRLTSPEDDIIESPSVEEKVQKIVESDSPYLPVKSSNVAIDYKSSINPRLQPKLQKSGFTIFRQSTTKLENIKLPTSEANYNGLGGSSKEDVFPSPRPVQTGLKRHKSGSSVSSSKFRKLAPMTKVTDFLNTSSSQ